MSCEAVVRKNYSGIARSLCSHGDIHDANRHAEIAGHRYLAMLADKRGRAL